MEGKKFKLVQTDPWLEPSASDIEERYERFRSRLDEIEEDFGTLEAFADAYKYFGINYNQEENCWTYREWAPEAHGLYLTGEFNDWNPESHPLRKNDFGIWQNRSS